MIQLRIGHEFGLLTKLKKLLSWNFEKAMYMFTG